ncbi:amidase signature domain-containing protein [Aspergillus stella-maris]|uniref:amidase signature domain-containing protein n=1 Tax=Aspergillus stella-maris TaxID=1810926 RepID=UPI003CCD2DC6
MDSPVLNQLFRQLFRHPACQSLRPSTSSHTQSFRLPRSQQQCRTLLTRRTTAKRKAADNGTNWTKRGDYPKDITNEMKSYPLVTAKELRHRQDRPRQVQMLTREFIDDSLYNPYYGYFSKHATIFSPGEPFDFNSIEDGPAFHRMLGERYIEFEDLLDEKNPDEARQLWHTPTELFRPYYGETIARYLVSNYKLTLYPYHDLIIYEMGAGNGTLMINILDFIRDTDYEVYQRTKFRIIEISPALAGLQMKNLTDSLYAAGHLDHVEIINKSIFEWDTYVHSPCFFLALEVIDNFSHDAIRYDVKTEVPQQGGVLIDADGEFHEFWTPKLDPVASRFLRVRQAAARRQFPSPLGPRLTRQVRGALPFQKPFTLPEYIPTRLMQFFDILDTYFPGHKLLASDFSTLPDAVPGLNAPVVQTRYKRRTVPVSTPFVHQGYFDIFFPTDFNVVEDIYRAVTGKLTQVSSHEDFINRWAYIEDTETKSGENPLLTWYKNASMIMTKEAMAEPHWKPTVHQKRAAQAAAVPPAWRLSKSTLSSKATPLETIRTCGILSNQELLWTDETNITALTSLLASGSITSEQLTTAFCKRAAIAQQLTGCLTEIFFDKALERAKRLDEEFKRSGEVSGPLHGVPVSVKDRFAVEGYDTTVGWVGLANKPAKESDAVMSDSYNHVFGQSLNSLNTALISGGSSGGEGALVGCGGSILGIGTDIGGSIRVPSNLQGLYSICPSTGRVPWDCSYMHQHYLVPPVAGPMARSIDTIEYFMASLSDSAPWDVDPGCIPISWRKELAAKPELGKKLKLGIVYDDGVVRPQPPVARAMREVAKKLVDAGHEGEPLWTKSVTADGGSHCHNLTTIIDEPLIAGMIVGTSSTLLNAVERETLEEEKYAFQQSYLSQWKKEGIDALLLPVTPWVGYRPKEWVKSSQWLGYSAVFNLLDYAGVTVPVSTVDEGLDKPDASWEEYGEQVRHEADRFNWAQYDVDLVKGMPVTVQIVGGRFGEEKAVSVAKVVDGLFGR